jgi:RHS repeat-associated protein
VQAALQYDTLNRVTGLATRQTCYAYQRGPTGNLTSATELNGRTVGWTYDGIYRLTGETISLAPSHNNGSASYGLDPVGNRTSETASLPDIPSGNFNFNVDDELSSESYDQNGNVTASGGKTFSYDSQNELLTMASSGTAVSLVYDAFGNRVAKTVNGVTTQYLVDDLNPTGYPQVFEELSGGAVTRTYTYGLQRIDEEQVISSAWTPSFYGYDGGGNVRTLTNSAGTVTDTYEYDAFGNAWTVSGTTPNEMMYRGEQYDSDLGLYYLRARYYSCVTGRFVNRDPEVPELIDLSGVPTDPKYLHKYVYANGDPINGIDPIGRMDTTADGWDLSEPKAGGDFVDYALLVTAIGLGTVAADKEVACAINIAYNRIAKTAGVGFEKVAIPESAECSAKDDGCDKEWRNAREYCAYLGSIPRKSPEWRKIRNIWGGSYERCVRGQVSERCGGNKVD